MKKLIIAAIFLLIGKFVTAQVDKAVIVEHFTNSRCGICANKNPGLHQNLANNPDVMHLSFYPSSPYASCIFSQHNPVENDNRTKYYSIFGGTPWLVINGQVQSSSTNFGNPALFDPFYGQTTPFSVYIKEYRYEEDNIRVEVTIKALSEHEQAQALLFLGFAEDTVFYESPNGEDLHTDVFRKALTDVEGDIITLPMNGDSVTLIYNVAPNSVWDMDRMYTTAILQDPVSKALIQAGKTNIIEYMDPSFISIYTQPGERLNIYPNPATGSKIYILNPENEILLFSAEGKLINRFPVQNNEKTSIDISMLQKGIYFLRSGNKGEILVVIR